MSPKLKKIFFCAAFAVTTLIGLTFVYQNYQTSISQSSFIASTGFYCEAGPSISKMAYIKTNDHGLITAEVPNGLDNPELKTLYIFSPKHAQQVILFRLYFPQYQKSPISYYELIISMNTYDNGSCSGQFQFPWSEDV